MHSNAGVNIGEFCVAGSEDEKAGRCAGSVLSDVRGHLGRPDDGCHSDTFQQVAAVRVQPH